MSVHILGSSGFLSNAFQQHKHSSDFNFWGSRQNKSSHYFDLYNPTSWKRLIASNPQTVVINSWPGLPNYQENHHLTKTLPAMISLIDTLIDCDCHKIVVTGTCYEYGDMSGMLSESMITNPKLPYSIAKDSLRRYIELKYSHGKFQYVWTRIFYPFGIKQNKNSLFPSLIDAIKRNKPIFRIGSASALRDFVPIKNVINEIVQLIYHTDACGIYNICSGKPQTVYDFCSSIIELEKSPIKLVVDPLLVRSSEPSSFWGSRAKISSLLNQ